MYGIILQIMAVIYFIVGATQNNFKSSIFMGSSFAIISGISIYNNLWIIGILFIVLSLIELSESFLHRDKILDNEDNNGKGNHK